MAIEKKRGCGYRKVGGLYMVTGAFGESCDRLPIEAKVCSCCGEGIKQGLGWKWVEPFRMFKGKHSDSPVNAISGSKKKQIGTQKCSCKPYCVVCNPVEDEKAGLMWVGTRFYPTPEDFLKESAEMGISKRVKSIPHDFEIGKTWILLAHPKAILRIDITAKDEKAKKTYLPGIFAVFKPTKIELLVQEKKATKAAIKKLEKRGITTVIVPDNDPDHFGSAHDSKKKQKKLAKKFADKKRK